MAWTMLIAAMFCPSRIEAQSRKAHLSHVEVLRGKISWSVAILHFPMLCHVGNTDDDEKMKARKMSQNAAGTTTQSWNKPVTLIAPSSKQKNSAGSHLPLMPGVGCQSMTINTAVF